jgi:putative ABC transport system permease protein
MSESHLGRDLRYAFRVLRRNPGFTATVVLTLGVGMGVCAAAFSMMGALLLRPLPFPRPDELVHVWGSEGGSRQYVSPLDIEDMREAVPAFAHVGGFNMREFNLSGAGDQPELVPGARVTAGVFPALGVRPALGRGVEEADERSGAAVVVLSDGLWRRRFGADPGVLGKSVLVHAQPHTVVGVMPPGFVFPNPVTNLWVPAQLTEEQRARDNASFQVVARLKPGSGDGQARSQLSTLASTLAARYPDSHRDARFEVVPLREALTFAYDVIKMVSWIMVGAVAFSLLLVCANVASLMLARFAARTQEVAIRKALGARPERLVKQFLVESLLLSLAGGAVGLLAAQWLIRAGSAFVPDDIYRVGSFGIDLPTALFTLALVVVTAVLVGLLPALRVARAPVADHLDNGTRATESRRSRRRFDVLVVAQFAAGCVLLVGALLMLRSVQRLQTVDPGFDPGVLSLKLNLPAAEYPEEADKAGFVRDARARIGGLPGVRATAAVSFLPLNNETLRRRLRVEGTDVPDDERPSAIVHSASAGFVEAMGIPLVAGRAFAEGDDGAAAPVAVVNRSFARRFLPEGNPVGARIALGGKAGEAPEWRTVVGVVADHRHESLKGAAEPQAFVPYAQAPSGYLRLLVRADGDALALVPAVRRSVAAVDPDVPLTEPRLLRQVVAESLAPERFTSMALVGLGAAALVLAAIGLYGVMAFRVVRSTREIGVRMALGASRRGVLTLMLGQAGRLTAIGLAIGLAGAAGLSFGLSRLLFGITPLDPPVYAAVAVVLGAVAILASLLPVLRASRVDPMEALRHD